MAVGRRPQFFFLQSERPGPVEPRRPDGLSWEIPTVVSTTSTGDSDQPYSTWNRGSPGPPLTQRCPLAPAHGGTPAPGTPLASQEQFRGLQTTRPEKWAPCPDPREAVTRGLAEAVRMALQKLPPKTPAHSALIPWLPVATSGFEAGAAHTPVLPAARPVGRGLTHLQEETGCQH